MMITRRSIDSARDLDHLLLGDRELAHQRQRVDREADARRDLPGLLDQAPPAENARPPGSRPMKTFSATVRLGKVELLVDRSDAERLGVLRGGRTRCSPATSIGRHPVARRRTGS